MSWVSIDHDACTKCGICVVRCAQCFREINDKISVRADEDRCNLCGHCISLCPTDALVHHKLDMENFPKLDNDKLAAIGMGEFTEMVRARRSQRVFKDKPIERADLEKLVDLVRYSPTGSNKQNTGVMVIEDRDKIKKLSDLTVDYFEQNVERMEDEKKAALAGGPPIPDHMQHVYSMTDAFRNLIMARQYGLEVIFHNAPAVFVFHAPLTTSSPKDDCVIASTTVGLAAMTMGIGSCYIGLFEFAARDCQPILDELNLGSGRRVFSVLVAGYSKLKYQRSVDRKPIDVRWE